MESDSPPNGVLASGIVQGDTAEDERLLRDMLQKARSYVASMPWCREVQDVRFAFGIGKIVLIAAVAVASDYAEVPRWHWVVVGDLPSAYIDVSANPTAKDALAAYCECMQEWVDAVRAGESTEACFPINVPPTTPFADMLTSRVAFLRDRILPTVDAERRVTPPSATPPSSRLR